MKRIIFHLCQKGGLRIAVCALAIGLSTGVYAQTDDDDLEETTTIKKPKRSEVKQKVYPMMTVKGVVTDLATNKPLAGVQLRSLANDRFTAMTNETGAFSINVPVFTTALYVYAPEYLSQQVAIKAEEEVQQIAVKLLSDKFQSMYGTGTNYTAKRTAQIDRFGVVVDNEIANELGGDMRSIQRSAVIDGGATMFIRGLNSITSDAQPLILIDGVEVDMQRNRYSLHDGQFNNILANISPDDIEKVTEVAYNDERITIQGIRF